MLGATGAAHDPRVTHTDLGPPDLVRDGSPDRCFAEHARRAAAACGVTRLADITRLDRLGLPVWQAIRPAGRALSVHQGKGATTAAAQVGALCEAIESHCAETSLADGPHCGFADLPPSYRAPDISDYCKTRDLAQAAAAARPTWWCRANDVVTGAELYLPHALLSLDYTTGLPSPFERTSLGLGAGPDQGHALSTALLEVVERDAVGAWQRLNLVDRLRTVVNPATIPFGWFQGWRDRLGALAIDPTTYRIVSPTAVPVLKCVIGGVEEFGDRYRIFSGTAAHPDPEIALFKALAEAVQSRLTWIAGVRDDILPAHYAARSARVQHTPLRKWEEVQPAPNGLAAIVESIARAGYRQVLYKRLDRNLDGVAVVKAFVPGLGSLSRTRRAVR